MLRRSYFTDRIRMHLSALFCATKLQKKKSVSNLFVSYKTSGVCCENLKNWKWFILEAAELVQFGFLFILLSVTFSEIIKKLVLLFFSLELELNWDDSKKFPPHLPQETSVLFLSNQPKFQTISSLELRFRTISRTYTIYWIAECLLFLRGFEFAKIAQNWPRKRSICARIKFFAMFQEKKNCRWHP